jgi:crotonobetainyl-CoA:carnitine CoA-transferase CaiB-like acyl-CoA transferase
MSESTNGPTRKPQRLPLEGVRVVELTHIVAGPSGGLILADLGADVTKVEHPQTGDSARSQANFGATFFSFNRNKKSLAVDLRTHAGQEVFRRLVERSDVVLDNLAPGSLDRLGLGYEWGSQVNPGIIYCGVKGFLPGPYESRLMLDELAQMMGGLAYLTGFKDQPLRAGGSIIDIGAATYGVVGILAALYRRQQTGLGDDIRAGLFETCVFWINQQFARAQLSGKDPQPRAGRESGMGDQMGWGVYQLFPTRDERVVFIAVTSNRHWKRLCKVLGYDDWADDPAFQDNHGRSRERKRISERIAASVRELDFDDIVSRLDAAEVPYAPVNSPRDVLNERHLRESGFWHAVEVPDHGALQLPSLPVKLGQTEPVTVRSKPPRLGEHTDSVLAELGYSPEQIEALKAEGAVRRSELMLNIEKSSE